VENYPYPVKEGQRYIYLNPDHLFVQQPLKKGNRIERLTATAVLVYQSISPKSRKKSIDIIDSSEQTSVVIGRD